MLLLLSAQFHTNPDFRWYLFCGLSLFRSSLRLAALGIAGCPQKGQGISSCVAEGNWYAREATPLGRRATPQETTEDHVDSVPIAATQTSESEDKNPSVTACNGSDCSSSSCQKPGHPPVTACNCSD